jgi:hypothetical protein
MPLIARRWPLRDDDPGTPFESGGGDLVADLLALGWTTARADAWPHLEASYVLRLSGDEGDRRPDRPKPREAFLVRILGDYEHWMNVARIEDTGGGEIETAIEAAAPVEESRRKPAGEQRRWAPGWAARRA